MDLKALSEQVLHNCRISDAQHAGIYSICGLAMRLRDLFKWQHALAPWVEKESSQVLDWIGRQEALWETLMEEAYSPIILDGRHYDPFDTTGINLHLNPEGLFYGAGYAHSMKPSFLLATVEKSQRLKGYDVLLLGREHARDLLTLPAFVQDGRVIIRGDAARMYLWDQILYIRDSKRPALHHALKRLGIEVRETNALRAHLGDLADVYRQVLLHHEIGELADTHFPAELWREILSQYPHSPVELLARALKDLLADTGGKGMLAHIIETRNSAALALYLAFRDGLTEALFPELESSFLAFQETFDWGLIVDAARRGHLTARRQSRQLISLYLDPRNRKDPSWALERVVEDMIRQGFIKR